MKVTIFYKENNENFRAHFLKWKTCNLPYTFTEHYWVELLTLEFFMKPPTLLALQFSELELPILISRASTCNTKLGTYHHSRFISPHDLINFMEFHLGIKPSLLHNQVFCVKGSRLYTKLGGTPIAFAGLRRPRKTFVVKFTPKLLMGGYRHLEYQLIIFW